MNQGLRSAKAFASRGRLGRLDVVRRSLTFRRTHVRPLTRRRPGGIVLTARQQQIWDFLVHYVDATGIRRPCARSARPSGSLRRRRCTRTSRTSSGPACWTRPDEAAGARALAARRRAASRRQRRARKLPLVGEIAAGGPLLAEENIEDYLAVPEPLARGDFLLRVKGDSMVGAGILDGDIVVVRRRGRAGRRDRRRPGGRDEAADEATVKTFLPRAATASACSPRTTRSRPSTRRT